MADEFMRDAENSQAVIDNLLIEIEEGERRKRSRSHSLGPDASDAQVRRATQHAEGQAGGAAAGGRSSTGGVGSSGAAAGASTSQINNNNLLFYDDDSMDAGFLKPVLPPLEGPGTFLFWQAKAEQLFKSIGLWPIIDGTRVKPQPEDSTYSSWVRDDANALVMINNSLGPKAIEAMKLSGVYNRVGGVSAQAVYKRLVEKYSSTVLSERQLFEEKFHRLALKEGASPTTFINNLYDLAEEVRARGGTVDFPTLKMRALSALPDSYAAERTAIQAASCDMNDEGKFKTLFLSSTYRSKSVRATESTVPMETASFANSSSRGRGRGGRGAGRGGAGGRGGFQNASKTKFEGKCYHCGKPGHRERDCWELQEQESRSAGRGGAHGGRGRPSQSRQNFGEGSHAIPARARMATDYGQEEVPYYLPPRDVTPPPRYTAYDNKQRTAGPSRDYPRAQVARAF